MSPRILSKTENQIILDEGEGYRIKATAQRVGAFALVVVDCEHPNYGYFADAMLCFKSLHMFDWNAIPIANWCWKYKSEEGNLNSRFLLGEFLKGYPELKELFKLKVDIWDNFVFVEILNSANIKWEDVTEFQFEFTEDTLEIILGKIKGIKKHGSSWLYKFEKFEIIAIKMVDNWITIKKVRRVDQKL